jgi:hypothetical protein
MGPPCTGDLARDWLAWCRGNARDGVARLLQWLGIGRHLRIGDAGAHRRIKMADRDLIANRLRLGLCGIYAELERMIDPPALLPLLVQSTATDGPFDFRREW